MKFPAKIILSLIICDIFWQLCFYSHNYLIGPERKCLTEPPMGCLTLLLIFVVSISTIVDKDVKQAELVVDSTARLGKSDENYICATIDGWPYHKC